MSSAGLRWGALGLGVGGAAVGELVWAPAGVALTFAAVVVGFGAIKVLNVLASRLTFVAAAALHGLVIARASGEPLLGLAPVVALAVMVPWEGVGRRAGYQASWAVPVAFAVELALGAAVRPPGPWHLALLPTLLFMLFFAVMFVVELRRLERRAAGVTARVGDVLPDFTLPARLGRGDFQLSAHRGHHLLLCLLRGDWCPMCQVMMRIITKDMALLAAHDVRVVAVSASDGPEADDFARLLGVDYPVLVDPSCTVAALLGAVDADRPEPGRSTNLPAMCLVGPDGRLRFVSTAADLTVHDPRAILRHVRPTSS